MRRRAPAVLAAVLLVAATAGCTSGGAHRASPTATGPSVLTSSAPLNVGGTAPVLAGAERSYGPSVGAIPGAQYQPAVVLIGGGAAAIESAQDNGLVWTLHADAPGVDHLAVGKIMVATALATGRVEALRRDGATDQVVLAPVGLADVFRQLDVTSTSPVTLQQPLAYSYADSPAASTVGDPGAPAAPPTDPSAATSAPPSPPPPLRFAAAPRAAAPRAAPPVPTVPSIPPGPTGAITLPQPTLQPKAAHEGKLDLLPYCCFPSQGVHITYSEPTGRMAATVGLVMNSTPLVDFHIRITPFGLQEAVFQLTGPKAIEFQFDAATKDVSGNYRSPTLRIPLAFTFPVAGIPFTVSLTQSVRASIQLAGQAAFSSKGQYAISGGLGFAYRNGSFGVTRPSFGLQLSAIQNATSLAVGINALSLTYTVRLSVGIGLPAFNGGPFVELVGTLAMSKDGSPPQTSLTAGCAFADVNVDAYFGVAYQIPEFVTNAVNHFLSLFDAAPINSSGGQTWGPYSLWNPGLGKQCLHR